MFLKFIVTIGVIAAAARATAQSHTPGLFFGCGSPNISQHLLPTTREIQAREGDITKRSGSTSGRIVVDTYIHVLAENYSEAGGYLSYQTIRNEIRRTNQQFSVAGFSFDIKGIDREVRNWPSINLHGYMTQSQMTTRRNKRKGGNNALNLYYITDTQGGPLGACTLPKDASSGVRDIDGCYIHYASIPGLVPEFKKGHTATVAHEIGHWLGLAHPFDGGCTMPNDNIDDTPPQAKAIINCTAVAPNSCPGFPGRDPIDNFMGYTNPPCPKRFTNGQITVMKRYWQYRDDAEEKPQPWTTNGASRFRVGTTRNKLSWWQPRYHAWQCAQPGKKWREDECGSAIYCQRYDDSRLRPNNLYANSDECVEARNKPW